MNPLQVLLKDIKEKVEQFNANPMAAPVVPATQEVAMYSLEDGTKVSISELVVGGVVTLEDGTPAPAGEHKLADGTKIEVGEGGVIAGIEAVEMPEAEDMGKKYAEKFAAIEGKVSAFEAAIQASEQKFATLEQAHTNLHQAFTKQNEALTGLVQLVDTLINEPNGTPAQQPNTFKAVQSKEDKVKAFSTHIHSILNKQ